MITITINYPETLKHCLFNLTTRGLTISARAPGTMCQLVLDTQREQSWWGSGSWRSHCLSSTELKCPSSNVLLNIALRHFPESGQDVVSVLHLAWSSALFTRVNEHSRHPAMVSAHHGIDTAHNQCHYGHSMPGPMFMILLVPHTHTHIPGASLCQSRSVYRTFVSLYP